MPPRGVGDVVASFQAVAAMGSVASHAAHGSHGLLGGLRVSRLQAGLSFFFGTSPPFEAVAAMGQPHATRTSSLLRAIQAEVVPLPCVGEQGVGVGGD